MGVSGVSPTLGAMIVAVLGILSCMFSLLVLVGLALSVSLSRPKSIFGAVVIVCV